MPDPVTREFADWVVREFTRFQAWNCDQDKQRVEDEKRWRKSEVKLAIIWWAAAAAVVIIGFLLTVFGWVLG